jgi:hypothetical protein
MLLIICNQFQKYFLDLILVFLELYSYKLNRKHDSTQDIFSPNFMLFYYNYMNDIGFKWIHIHLASFFDNSPIMTNFNHCNNEL